MLKIAPIEHGIYLDSTDIVSYVNGVTKCIIPKHDLYDNTIKTDVPTINDNIFLQKDEREHLNIAWEEIW